MNESRSLPYAPPWEAGVPPRVSKDAPPNGSGFSPLGRAVLCAPYEPEREESIIALPESVLRNERVLDVKVRVVAVGPVCWPDEPARAHPGDVVLVAKMSGFVAQGVDKVLYRFVNDRDVFAKVEVSHG